MNNCKLLLLVKTAIYLKTCVIQSKTSQIQDMGVHHQI